MPTDNRVISQDKIDPTSSLLVDAHSLKALPFTQCYSSDLRIGEAVNQDKVHDELDHGLALASLIQNIVLYDTVVADSLLLQTEPGGKEAFDLFPEVIKGVYLETALRRKIGDRVYTVVPIWDRLKRPRGISVELWNHILLIESKAKRSMDRMTKVVPNLMPPEYEFDTRRNWAIMRLESDAKENSTSYENLPDCCVNSSACLARTHYYLELARELSVPLNVHPIRSGYLEALVTEYKQEYDEYILQQQEEEPRAKSQYSQEERIDKFLALQNRISRHLGQSDEANDEWIAELHQIAKELSRLTEREQIVAYADNIILKEAIKESGSPLSLELEIPPIAEMVMSYAARKKCRVYEAIIEIRNSKNATKFREWCQVYSKAGMAGRPGRKEQVELHKDLVKACNTWKDDIKEDVDYKTRTISLEKLPIIGGVLKSLNMDKASFRDPVLAPKTKSTYFLLLNDLYRSQPKNLF